MATRGPISSEFHPAPRAEPEEDEEPDHQVLPGTRRRSSGEEEEPVRRGGQPSPPLSAPSVEEPTENESFSSLEAEWSSDGEMVTDPTEDQVDWDVGPSSQELNFHIPEAGDETPGRTVHHRNVSEDVDVCRFADEDEEEEDVSVAPAGPSADQQVEPSPQTPNQEAARQVLGRSSSPLWSVAMAPSSGGGAAGRGSLKGNHSRRTGVEGRQRGTAGNRRYLQGMFSLQGSAMESDSCDDSQSDSGVSADFSPCSTSEGNLTVSPGSPAAVHKETPIEREIRRAVEREHSLRRSRGLPNPPASPEYVEIPLRKTVLCQKITERSRSKDRQFAGKKMQQEIHEETRREEDLVKQGKLPGRYDRGTVREVREKKQLFEAFQKPSETRSKAGSWSISSTRGDPYVERSPRGPGLSEGTSCQVIILENCLSLPAQKFCHAKPGPRPAGRPNTSWSRTGGHGGMNEEEEEEELKENPFFKLRSSTNGVKVEQDIREAQEREKELHQQRVSLYGGRQATSSPPPPSGLSVPHGSSRQGASATAARQTVGRLGAWPPPQAGGDKIDQSESPRTPRKKNLLVQRWESGLINGENVEEP